MLREFIKKLYWKVYGKAHLIRTLKEESWRIRRAYGDKVLIDGSFARKRLFECLAAIKDVEKW